MQAVLETSLEQAKTHRVVSGWEARLYLAGESPFEDRHWHPLPSLIVLDLGLPDTSGFDGGFEVLAWLAEHEQVSQIPVIVFTAAEDPEHARRAYKLGARRFIQKAGDYEELMEAIKEELQQWIEEHPQDGGN